MCEIRVGSVGKQERNELPVVSPQGFTNGENKQTALQPVNGLDMCPCLHQRLDDISAASYDCKYDCRLGALHSSRYTRRATLEQVQYTSCVLCPILRFLQATRDADNSRLHRAAARAWHIPSDE